MNRILIPFAIVTALLPFAAAQPMVGEKAPDFALSTLEGKTLRLSEATLKGTVVLIVLRGYPGYQCPFCNRQVQDFLQNSQAFNTAGASVVLVYPGPADGLGMRANEFLAGRRLPDHFTLLLDPDYALTNLYGIRWNAAHETAYPSTFVIDGQGMVTFRKVVKEHGGRTTAAEILGLLSKR